MLMDSHCDNDNIGHRKLNTSMPPIGTRVRRGQDWLSMFGEQDSRGPGTVVGHDRDGKCFLRHHTSIRLKDCFFKCNATHLIRTT